MFNKQKIKSLSIVLTIILLFFCNQFNILASETLLEEITKTVTIYKVKNMLFQETKEYSGDIIATQSIIVHSKIPGTLTDIFVQEGSEVNKDQILAQLDTEMIELKIKETQIGLDIANANLRQANAKLKEITADKNRFEIIYEKGSLDKRALDKVESGYDQTVAAVDIARSQISKLEVLLKQININYKYHFINSFFSGVITKKLIDAGSEINQQVSLFELSKIDHVKMVINVPEKEFINIHKNISVFITTDVYLNKKFNGTINIIHPQIDIHTRTFKTEININNQDRLLKPGMFAYTQIPLQQMNIIAVPAESIKKIDGTGTYFVFIATNNIIEKRIVKIGLKNNGFVQIISGLNENELVVRKGTENIKTGDKVKIISGGI